VTSITESNATSEVYITTIAALWSNTAAITSIKVTCGGSNSFVSGSSFFLYGIAKS
jgi:hypothetical protein